MDPISTLTFVGSPCRYPIGKRRKCTVSGSASCPALQDALAEMVGDADDAVGRAFFFPGWDI